MWTLLAIAGVGVLFPLIFRLADKMGDWTHLMAFLKRIHAI
jgi:hypothetical protein